MLQQNKLSVAQKTSLIKNIEKEKEADRKIREGSNIKNKWPQNPSHKKRFMDFAENSNKQKALKKSMDFS